jgi:hypothetical protein
MNQRLTLILLAIIVLLACLLAWSCSKTCPECPPEPVCPDCDLERALEDPDYPLAPIVEARWCP